MENVLALADIGSAWLVMALVVFLRIGTAILFLPGFGERSVPQRVRLALAVAFTIIVTPTVGVTGGAELPLSLVPVLAAETLVGAVLGLSIRMMIFILQIAGSIAAQSTSLAQIFGGASTEPLPAFGHVLVVAGLALAMLAGLHIRLTEAFIGSYQWFPVGAGFRSADLAEFWTAKVSGAFSLAFTFSAPFVVAAFIYNLALGAINRAMPQLMVVLVGAPAITATGLAMLAILSPLMLELWRDALDAVLAAPLRATL
ncbi:flagellar biosynthetic protein FliR [Tropicimonas marinistellae]|uniref:flagellar biosynthetic protein FliR n=1 Tax=Tropicimonas marinistellae TaxID=1739787 RepID=UPI000835CFCA|nr:flagellar biosynthetic protein FliR [Tropicimonas marinistellae]